MNMPKRLLILSCSQRKHPDPGLLPAIERYDGPQFQIVRKYLRAYPAERQSLAVYILSAKFGLILANQPIPNYNQRMTPKYAQELQPQVLPKLESLLSGCDELFINLGQSYWQVLVGYEKIIPPHLTPVIAQGSQGRRQVELHDWLYRGLPESSSTDTPTAFAGKARIRGVEINHTPAQILALACERLRQDGKDAANYQAWYVQVDDRQVSPKWLVSQLIGLPVGDFHSGEARRVLQQLGVEVKKV